MADISQGHCKRDKQKRLSTDQRVDAVVKHADFEAHFFPYSRNTPQVIFARRSDL